MTVNLPRIVVVAFRTDRDTAQRIRAAAKRDARRPSAFLSRLVRRALAREEIHDDERHAADTDVDGAEPVRR